MGNCAPDVMKPEADTLSTNWPKTDNICQFCMALQHVFYLTVALKRKALKQAK